MLFYKLFTGNCAILYKGEDIYTVDDDRLEGFATVAKSENEAIQQVKNAFSADELGDEEAFLVVIVLHVGELTEGPVLLFEPFDWPEDHELTSM